MFKILEYFFSESRRRSVAQRRSSQEIQEDEATQLQEDREGQLQRSTKPQRADGTTCRENRTKQSEVAHVVKTPDGILHFG